MIENKDYEPLPVEPKNPKVKELYYNIFYEHIDITQVVEFIDKNTTKNSLSLFLDELYLSYFDLIGFLIHKLEIEYIEEALHDPDAEINYIDLSDLEKDTYSANIRSIKGEKVIFGNYHLRNRITKNKAGLYYIDNAVIDYFSHIQNNIFQLDFIDDFNNLMHYRNIYLHLINDIFSNVILPKKIEEKTGKQESFKAHEEIINSSEYPKSNPYPRILTSDKAYSIFEKFLDFYKDDKHVLANFSFLFHAMQKDGFIHDSANRTEYIKMLSEKDIHIDKVKTYSDIGNKKDKTLIYNSMKIN